MFGLSDWKGRVGINYDGEDGGRRWGIWFWLCFMLDLIVEWRR